MTGLRLFRIYFSIRNIIYNFSETEQNFFGDSSGFRVILDVGETSAGQNLCRVIMTI